MLFDYIASALATLLIVADPVFLSALFLGVTHGMGEKQRREVALRAAIIALCILIAAGLGGAQLLGLLGISLSAFRIAGGLLLLSSAAEMVFDRRSQRLQATADQAIGVDHVKNIAAFPLAIPLMAGPGAITAMIWAGAPRAAWTISALCSGSPPWSCSPAICAFSWPSAFPRPWASPAAPC
jgi:multiple antibiotic resistance protein